MGAQMVREVANDVAGDDTTTAVLAQCIAQKAQKLWHLNRWTSSAVSIWPLMLLFHRWCPFKKQDEAAQVDTIWQTVKKKSAR